MIKCLQPRNKRDELQEVARGVDLIGIAETWLKDTDELNLPGFVVLREDRAASSGGGCLLAIRDTIPHLRNTAPYLGNHIQLVDCDLRAGRG